MSLPYDFEYGREVIETGCPQLPRYLLVHCKNIGAQSGFWQLYFPLRIFGFTTKFWKWETWSSSDSEKCLIDYANRCIADYKLIAS